MKQTYLKLLAKDLEKKILSSKNYSNKPFDHLFVDNFLPKKFAKLCEKSFPNLKKYKLDHKK